MTKHLYILLFLLLGFEFCPALRAQIVNIESIRGRADTTHWSGRVSLSSGLIQNNNRILTISARLRLDYQRERHAAMLINDYNLKRSNGQDLVDNGLVHLRYNYQMRSRLTYEAFTQAQFNDISRIRLRFLLGTGLRYELIKKENSHLYLGVAAMYEYEHLKEEDVNIFRRSPRNSNYISASIALPREASFVTTLYYQPRFDQWTDFRLASESILNFPIFQRLAFRSSFSIWHNAFPAAEVRKTQYHWNNGLTFSF